MGHIRIVARIQRLQFGVLVKNALDVPDILFTRLEIRNLIIEGMIGD